MDFKDKIKKLRSNLNLTLKEVAERVGVSEATIQRYESGEIKNVRRDKILALANALQTTPGYLMDWEKLGDASFLISEDSISYNTHYSKVKVHGKLCAGNGKLAYEDFITEITNPYIHVKGELIGLQVDGESMNKVVHNGDYAIIKMQPNVENGQIAAVMIDQEDAMLKRFYRVDDETVMLKPESDNPDFKAITFIGNDINKLKIIGKYMGHVSPCVE